MADSVYYECNVWKELPSKKMFKRTIGSAKLRDDGGFSVYLDALPLDGKFTIQPKVEREGYGQRGGGRQTRSDDDAPF